MRLRQCGEPWPAPLLVRVGRVVATRVAYVLGCSVPGAAAVQTQHYLSAPGFQVTGSLIESRGL